MDEKDILSIDDWIKISIRFSGSCLICKKKLLSGEYGYWSKKFKSILHEACYDKMFKTKTSNEMMALSKGNQSINSQINLIENGLIDFVNKNNNKIKCFICKNKIDFNDQLIISLLKMCNKNYDNLDTLYCSNCLRNFDIDTANKYEKHFLDQIS